MLKTLFQKKFISQTSNYHDDENIFEIELGDLFPNYELNHDSLDLPDCKEALLVRHYNQLSKETYGTDDGPYPLGSCTMKYNPKRNEKFSQFDGFRYTHPYQPKYSLSGTWELIYKLQELFCEIFGMDKFTLQPAAGAHGEFTSLLIIDRYYKHKKENRNKILIADNAHGTNPASARMANFNVEIININNDGLIDIKDLSNKLDNDTACFMLTNPSTYGLFEKNILQINDLVKSNGSLLYYDGANFNAIIGRVKPGEMGFDIMHLNTHKTFSTPHGGGGPGSGPVGVKSFLKEYLPIPVVIKDDKENFIPDYNLIQSIGKVKSFYGHIEVLIKAYSYIRTLGSEGLRNVSKNAVLNANYIQSSLKKQFKPFFNQMCMHETLLSGNNLPVSSYSFSKAIIDKGIHPPNIVGGGCVYYSPQHGNSFLIEPTESMTKSDLDDFIKIMINLYYESQLDPEKIKLAPLETPVSRIPDFVEEIYDHGLSIVDKEN